MSGLLIWGNSSRVPPLPSEWLPNAGFAARRADGALQARHARLDARERSIAARRPGRTPGEVAALEEIDEDVGDLPRAQRALGLVPLVEPVAHAEDAEHDERGR